MQTHQKRAKYCLKLQTTAVKAEGKNKKVFCICGRGYMTKSNLNRHRQSCSDLQGNVCEEVLMCRCGKEFSRRDNLKRHQAKFCTFEEPASVASSLDSQIDVVRMFEILADVAKSTGNNTVTNTNNNTINLQPITHQYMKEEGNRLLTKEVVIQGSQPKIAGKILKPRIRVADKSRNKIEYMDEEGKKSNDSQGLIKQFYTAIDEKNSELINEAYEEIRNVAEDLVARGLILTSNYTDVLREGAALQDMLIAIKNIQDDVLNEGSEKLMRTTIKEIMS